MYIFPDFRNCPVDFPKFLTLKNVRGLVLEGRLMRVFLAAVVLGLVLVVNFFVSGDHADNLASGGPANANPAVSN